MTTFKAPIKTLRSSWVQETFTKPKKPFTTIKRSLGSRPKVVIYLKGSIIKSSNDNSY